MRYVYNRYSRQSVFVKCGKCEACLQEKANYRTMRIKNNQFQGFFPLLVTLTYRNECCPYILRSDVERISKEVDNIDNLNDSFCVPVYRDSKVRRVRITGDYKMSYKTYDTPVFLNSLPVEPWFLKDFDKQVLKSLRNYRSKNKIGICYYKDVQDFIKRLKINLERRYDVHFTISFFSVSEYGPTTCRPHFHLLIWCPFGFFERMREAIHQAWPFDDLFRQARSVEVAKDAASYVSSYVNKSASVPLVLNTPAFRQKHSYSQGFGLASQFFSLASLLSKIERNDFTFDYQTTRDNIPVTISLPIPKYVVNRYFPRFTGLGRLNNVETLQLLRNPEIIGSFEIKDQLRIDTSQAKAFYIRLINARERSGLSHDDYAHYYVRAWQCHNNQILKSFYDNIDNIPFEELYDNLNFVCTGDVQSPTLLPLIKKSIENGTFIENPNAYVHRMTKTERLRKLYYDKMKTKEITNFALVESGKNF